ncbi:uncharacterized protein isoform X2 [Rhodnius prolixus]|uniref:uncharacterized protein isoform X2 n=1 Tax=Rhodnius prolixus TaxID=13249 RepID=UPI003D18E3DA
MEHLQGTSLKVILKIKKADLNGVKLETDELSPCEAPIFNALLTWEVEKNYLRRLRKTNTAFKIEGFIALNEGKRDKMGYIVLNLRQAQIIPSQSDIKENETWRNFLGVPRKIKAWHPQILIVFKIQEANTVGDCKNVNLSQNKLAPLPLKMEETKKCNYLQIGPSKLCSKFYELCIDINETGSLSSIISPNDIGTPLKIQFHIMGMSLITKEFYAFQGISNKEKFKVQIKSEIQFLAAYFKQFPFLTFYLICGEKLIGSGSMGLQDLTDLREHFTASSKEKITLKSVDGKEIHITDSLSPFLKVEVTLVPMLSKIESDTDLVVNEQNNDDLSSTIVQPQLLLSLQKAGEKLNHINVEIGDDLLQKEPSISCGFIPEIQLPNYVEKDQIASLQSAKQPDLERHIENTCNSSSPTEAKLQKDEELLPAQAIKISSTNDINSPKDARITSNSYQHHTSPQPCNQTSAGSPQFCHPSSSIGCSQSIANALPKIYVQELATKYIEELEDWKEKQQEMFKFELKRKTDKHLNKLSLEWTKRQQSLENVLTDRLENCQSLKSRLEEVLLELEIKIENLNKLEQELLVGKSELDRRYTMKFRELRKASKQHQRDMEEKIKRSDLEKTEIKNKLKEKESEISRLLQIIASESQSRLSVEETKKLLAEKEVLEQKLIYAIQERNYFKEQFNSTVRECEKLKEKREDEYKWRMKKDKEGLQIIGLVEEINNEVDEMRKDQTTLNTLRNEIIKYGVNT